MAKVTELREVKETVPEYPAAELERLLAMLFFMSRAKTPDDLNNALLDELDWGRMALFDQLRAQLLALLPVLQKSDRRAAR